MNPTNKTQAYENFEEAIKLSINQSLYDKGYITEEIYSKAKEVIISKK